MKNKIIRKTSDIFSFSNKCVTGNASLVNVVTFDVTNNKTIIKASPCTDTRPRLNYIESG